MTPYDTQCTIMLLTESNLLDRVSASDSQLDVRQACGTIRSSAPWVKIWSSFGPGAESFQDKRFSSFFCFQ